ncbi:substrate-binding periplasmic protein [Litoribrevibacter albus]|nr:transporter substrate-binding domain-containing protein [Litoribrevibacter albus]
MLVFAAPAISVEKNVVLGSSEYPPFFSEHLPSGGVTTEIVVEAFKKVGYTTTVTFMPFARTLKEGQLGSIDGIIALWHTQQREQLFVFSDPLPPNLIGLYKKKNKHIRFKTLSDLTPYTIGTVRGYSNPPGFKEANLQIEAAGVDDQNLLKLDAERFDLALIDKWVAQYLIRSKFPHLERTLEWLEPPLETKYQYLVFSKRSKGHEQRLVDFNAGLRELKASGEYQSILIKHGFED